MYITDDEGNAIQINLNDKTESIYEKEYSKFIALNKKILKNSFWYVNGQERF